MSQESPRRVLVIEDEVLIAMLIEDMLIELGCEIAAISSHFDEAIGLAQSQAVDFAILDVNLNGKPSFPVADILRARGIPFVFATGYGDKALGAPYAATPILHKPFQTEDLARALRQAGLPS